MERLNQLKQQLTKGYQKTDLEFEDEGRVGIINLNSPKELNALSDKLVEELSQTISTLDSDPQVKVIVIMSKVDKAFCAGADIKGFPNMTYESLFKSSFFIEFEKKLALINKPIIAACQGVSLGGGLELALTADIIVAREDAQFGLPEIKLGLIPGMGGTQRLAKIIGRVQAARYILTGDMFNAQQALQWGLVSDVFKKETFKEDVLKLARKIAGYPLISVLSAKRAVRQSEDLPVSEGIKYERSIFQPLFGTAGTKEGVKAFIERRKPEYKNL